MSAAHATLALPAAGFRAESFRGTEGFFRVGQDETARWWMLGPDGARFFAKAVDGVRGADAQPDGALARDSAARLRGWGFNALGVTTGGFGMDDGLPFIATVDFCDVPGVIIASGVRLPDVFDPAWQRRANEHAVARCAPLSGFRQLIGWASDSAIGWAQPSFAGRPSLLQVCLSLEPNFAAYHAAWEFVLALHGGRLESLARAWGATLPNKEVVRELTRADEGLGTRGYLRDEARWTREFARRYFTTTSAAIRAADPNHLVLGCRFGGPAGPQILAECAYPAVDVGLPDWRELPGQSHSSARVATEPVNPVMAGNVNWTTPDFLRLPVAARLLHLTSVEWMLRRARTALDRAIRNPAVVGYAWGQWQDEPGEQPPFAGGLIHGNGAEAREHTELLAQFNRRAEALHQSLPSP